MKQKKKDIDLILSEVLNKKVAHIFEVTNDVIENVYFFTKPSNKTALFNHIHQMIKKEDGSLINIHTNDFPTYILSKNTRWAKKENVNIHLISLEDYPRKEIYEERIRKLKINYKDDEKRFKKHEASTDVPDKDTLVVYTDASVVFNNSYELNASGYGIVVRAPGSDNIMYKIKARLSKPVLSAEAESLALKRGLRFVREQMNKGNIPNHLKVEIRSDNLGNVEKINNYLEDVYDVIKEDTLKKISDYVKNNFNKDQVSIKWVKGHHIDPYNLMVDQLAKESITHKNSNFIVSFRDKNIIEKLNKKNKVRNK